MLNNRPKHPQHEGLRAVLGQLRRTDYVNKALVIPELKGLALLYGHFGGVGAGLRFVVERIGACQQSGTVSCDFEKCHFNIFMSS